MLNQQAPEKRVRDETGLIDVHSIFYTIQGEGPFCGTPAVFIRLAGCNLQCPGCDTDYTSKRKAMFVPWIINEVTMLQPADARNTYARDSRGLVVITGGEPFRQDIGPLINALTVRGYYVQVETNGTLPPPMDVVFNVDPSFRMGAYIVCSPKAGKVHPDTSIRACCYKYVMSHNSVDPVDGLPGLALNHTAAPHVARPPGNWYRPIYLQPEDARNSKTNDKNLQACILSCMKHGYILQLQIHKLICME